MSDDPTEITLGDRDYKLVPQRIGRISRKLGAILSTFGGQAGLGGGDPLSLTGQAHEALKVFIPDLDPEWKLAGYPSAEAYEAVKAHRAEVAAIRADDPEAEIPDFDDPYDPEADKSPTPPEIADAIEAVWRVHGGDRLVRLLKSLVDTTVLRERLTLILQKEATEWSLRRPSPTSSAVNGTSASTPSGTSDPTPAPSEASPSLASSIS